MRKIIVHGKYVPQAYFAEAGDMADEIALLKGKKAGDQTRVYLCDMEACRIAGDDIKAVLQLLRK